MTDLKNEKYNELVVPIYFYCTFMEGVGMYMAEKRGKLRFMDEKHEISLKVAKNPSDLLHMNRGVSASKARIGGILIAFIVFLAVIFSAYLFIQAITI